MPPEICTDGGGGPFFSSHSFPAALYGPVYSLEILSFLPTTQHTRWDSSTRTVTQAFRHSLARTNTISVTFHYMVQSGISGLETHQIFTQGATPPRPCHCLSATMSNCFLFARLLPGIQICIKICIKTQTIFSSTATKTTGLTLSLRVNTRWCTFFYHVVLGVNLRLLFFCCFFFFQSGSCLSILPTPPYSGLLSRIWTAHADL